MQDREEIQAIVIGRKPKHQPIKKRTLERRIIRCKSGIIYLGTQLDRKLR